MYFLKLFYEDRKLQETQKSKNNCKIVQHFAKHVLHYNVHTLAQQVFNKTFIKF